MERKKYFRCPDCGIRFSRKLLLERHIAEHTGTLKFRCKECGLTFAKKTNLTNHLIVHNPEISQFSCNQCDKAFVSVHGLERHLLVHNAKLFTCRMCGEAFGSNYNLKRHRLKHRKSRKIDSDRIEQSSNDTQVLESGVSRFEDGDNLSVIEEERSEATPDVIEIVTDVSNNSLEIKTEPVIDVCLPKIDCGDNSNHLSVGSGKEKNSVAPDVGLIEIKTEILDDTFEIEAETSVTDSNLQNFPKHTETMKLICVVCGEVLKTKSGFKKHLMRHRKSKELSSNSNKPSESGILGTEDAVIDEQLNIISQHAEAPNLLCGQCGKVFDGNARLDFARHLTIHDQKSDFTCKECDLAFDSRHTFIEHLITHTRKYKCSHSGCYRVFNSEDQYERHLDTHCSTTSSANHKHFILNTRTSGFTCGECGDVFGLKGGLKIHLATHRRSSEFRCKECGETFGTEVLWKRHLVRHTFKERFDAIMPLASCPKAKEFGDTKCEIESSVKEGKIFGTSDAIATNKNVVDDSVEIDVKPVIDVILQHTEVLELTRTEVASNVIEVKTEILDEIEVNPVFDDGSQIMLENSDDFQCKEITEISELMCGDNRNTRTEVTSDVIEVKTEILDENEANPVIDDGSQIIWEESDDFHCGECGKGLKSKGGLRRHLMRHSQLSELHSEERKKSLQKLVLIDKAISELQCGHCGKVFVKKTDLNRHLVLHTGISKFHCEECDKAFGSKCDLKQHLELLHTRILKYRCNECDKALGSKHDFKRHLVLHGGKSGFTCNECDKSFGTMYDFKRHVVMHTETSQFQ